MNRKKPFVLIDLSPFVFNWTSLTSIWINVSYDHHYSISMQQKMLGGIPWVLSCGATKQCKSIQKRAGYRCDDKRKDGTGWPGVC